MARPKRKLSSAFALVLGLIAALSGCGRETKSKAKPELGQKALEQRTGKGGGRPWSIDSENYFVIGKEKELLLVQTAAAEALPKEMNGRLMAYSASMATAFPAQDKKDPVYLRIKPQDLLGEEGKSTITLHLLLHWDLSAYSGKEAAPEKNWQVAWGGLPDEVPSFTGKAKFKLYNVDDAKVNDLSGGLAAPKVAVQPGGAGFDVALALAKRGFPTARKLVGVATLEFSATDRWLMDNGMFGEFKGPQGGKPMIAAENPLMGGLLFGPVAHSISVFGQAGDSVFYPDLTSNQALLDRYHNWLKARYGAIETLNDYTEGGHTDFNKVAWRLNTLPTLGAIDKPETYKEWKTYTEAERTVRVQADFLKELRAKNVNRALLWLKERHPQAPVWLELPGEIDPSFVERAGIAGDGLVFQLRRGEDFTPAKPKYANLNENLKTRSGSTKFLGALLIGEAYGALASESAATALGESGFRGLFIDAIGAKPPKTLKTFEETARKTAVAKAIQEEPPESKGEKAEENITKRDAAEGPADFRPSAPLISGSPVATPPPGASGNPLTPTPGGATSPPATINPNNQSTGDRPDWMNAAPSPSPAPAAPAKPASESAPAVTPTRPTPPTAPVTPTPPAKPDTKSSDRDDEFGI